MTCQGDLNTSGSTTFSFSQFVPMRSTKSLLWQSRTLSGDLVPASFSSAIMKRMSHTFQQEKQSLRTVLSGYWGM